jgi:basic amino acid/polyamine antiporter, APA family
MKAAEGNKGPQLVRALGLWSAIAVLVGSMVGQSVFLVASDMARELGSATWVLVAWVVVAWSLIQAASILSPTFEARRWMLTVFLSP